MTYQVPSALAVRVRRMGVTLVELLVVMTVIAILIGILVPVGGGCDRALGRHDHLGRAPATRGPAWARDRVCVSGGNAAALAERARECAPAHGNRGDHAQAQPRGAD